MKGVFKCAMEDDERRSMSVKRSSLGMPMCTPNKYSRRLKRLSLGMPSMHPLLHQQSSVCLSLHYIFITSCVCAMLGASHSLLFLGFFALFAGHYNVGTKHAWLGEKHAPLKLEHLIEFSCLFFAVSCSLYFLSCCCWKYALEAIIKCYYIYFHVRN